MDLDRREVRLEGFFFFKNGISTVMHGASAFTRVLFSPLDDPRFSFFFLSLY